MSYNEPIPTQINFQEPWYNNLFQFNFNENKLASENITTLNDYLDILNKKTDTLFRNFRNLPLRFVAQECLPEGMAYESFIADTGRIPTRDNFHDVLNGLIWLNFPKSKAVFNQLHAKDIIENGISNARTPLRNALTLFDENGGIVVSSKKSNLECLQNFDWENILYHSREQWLGQNHHIAFFPIGHALLEKLINPRKNITSHTILIEVEDEWFKQSIDLQREQLDKAIAKIFLQPIATKLQNNTLGITSKKFQPLPVMGIPGYCNENQQADFYQDKSVFREPRDTKAPIFLLKDYYGFEEQTG